MVGGLERKAEDTVQKIGPRVVPRTDGLLKANRYHGQTTCGQREDWLSLFAPRSKLDDSVRHAFFYRDSNLFDDECVSHFNSSYKIYHCNDNLKV